MKQCLLTCKKMKVACPINECKFWVEYKEEYNCMFESVSINGSMTLREVADRLGVSFVRIKQIQDKALKKIGHLLKDEAI